MARRGEGGEPRHGLRRSGLRLSPRPQRSFLRCPFPLGPRRHQQAAGADRGSQQAARPGRVHGAPAEPWRRAAAWFSSPAVPCLGSQRWHLPLFLPGVWPGAGEEGSSRGCCERCWVGWCDRWLVITAVKSGAGPMHSKHIFSLSLCLNRSDFFFLQKFDHVSQ